MTTLFLLMNVLFDVSYQLVLASGHARKKRQADEIIFLVQASEPEVINFFESYTFVQRESGEIIRKRGEAVYEYGFLGLDMVKDLQEGEEVTAVVAVEVVYLYALGACGMIRDELQVQEIIL